MATKKLNERTSTAQWPRDNATRDPDFEKAVEKQRTANKNFKRSDLKNTLVDDLPPEEAAKVFNRVEID